MKAAQLFAPFRQFLLGEKPDRDVTLITADSRELRPGAVFVAVRGTKHDGHDFLNKILDFDLSAVVVEDTKKIPPGFSGAVLKVEDSREALQFLAAHFYGEPAKKLFNVGVTGTNGKTSVTYMIESVLREMQMPCGVIGTVNHHLGNRIWETGLTTPDPVTLHRRLSEFVSLGAKALAMEVSSHALDQGRARGVPFDAVVFTNLTRDHLDYHGTMENYFHAKEKLFLDVPNESAPKQVRAIINTSDEWGEKIQTASNVLRWTYGESAADFQFQILEMSYAGTRFRLRTPRGEGDFSIPLIGRHNVYNSVAAIAVGVAAGASLATAASGVQKFLGVPGRLERVAARDLNVFVDYAHTDDAIKTVLMALRQVREQGHLKSRILTVFGCGGDRDRGKRPLMAKVATELSDQVIITSDNPRSENPIAIIDEILGGVANELLNEKVFVEVDRREAIRLATQMARPGDVILIAGKGHETYQIVGSRRFDFSDAQIAREILIGL